MMPKKPAQTQDKYILRLPDGMRARIADVAKRNGRSINAEIIYWLDLSLRAEEQSKSKQGTLASLDSLRLAVQVFQAILENPEEATAKFNLPLDISKAADLMTDESNASKASALKGDGGDERK